MRTLHSKTIHQHPQLKPPNQEPTNRGMQMGYRLPTMVSVLTILRGLFMSVASTREGQVQGLISIESVQALYRK